MTAGTFEVFDAAFAAFLKGEWGVINAQPFYAVLLAGDYTPNLAVHREYGDIALHEVLGLDYRRVSLSGVGFDASGPDVSLTSDPVSWGQSVSIPPCRYLVVVRGAAAAPQLTDALLGVVELSVSGESVESSNGVFQLTPSEQGWFTVSKGSA